MAKSLSIDLRERLVSAVDGGMTRRSAAQRRSMWRGRVRSEARRRPRFSGFEIVQLRTEACRGVRKV